MIKYTYLLLIFIIIFIFIIISHKTENFRVNNELKIHQTEMADVNTIILLLKKKQPVIFIDEIGNWHGIDLLIGQEYEIIEEIIKNKDVQNNLRYYLEPFKLSFSSSWSINVVKNIENWESLPLKPYRQLNKNNYIGAISGLTMIFLINPSETNKKIINENENIKKLFENEEKSKELDYILIPLRLGNLIYIPYGWYFWIYNGLDEKYCCYLDLNNKLLF